MRWMLGWFLSVGVAVFGIAAVRADGESPVGPILVFAALAISDWNGTSDGGRRERDRA